MRTAWFLCRCPPAPLGLTCRQLILEDTMTEPLGFDTLAIHAGTAPDPATGARQVPIYQTTAYVFRDADHAISCSTCKRSAISIPA